MMGRCAIVFEDVGPGQVSMNAEFDPPVEKGETVGGARWLAMLALQEAGRIAKENAPQEGAEVEHCSLEAVGGPEIEEEGQDDGLAIVQEVPRTLGSVLRGGPCCQG